MSCANVRSGAQRRKRRRRKTQRRPFILPAFDFHFHYFELDVFGFLTTHLETETPVHQGFIQHQFLIFPFRLLQLKVPVYLNPLGKSTLSILKHAHENQISINKRISFCGSILLVILIQNSGSVFN